MPQLRGCDKTLNLKTSLENWEMTATGSKILELTPIFNLPIVNLNLVVKSNNTFKRSCPLQDVLSYQVRSSSRSTLGRES